MSDSILNMEPSICLSLPPLSSSATDNEKDASLTEQQRFIFVTENDFIHAAGNILQISSLPKSQCIDSPLDHLQSDISALSGQFSNANYRLITEEGVKFTEAKLQRGFSCFAYNSYKGRIAYSPRGTSPSIYVKSLSCRKLLSVIKGGASIEYADLRFNNDGSKIVAVGKGNIDSTLFVWSFKKNTSNVDGEKNPFTYTASLIVSHSIKNAALRCLFNPLNGDEIGIHSSDRASISIYRLTKFIGRHRVHEKCCITAQELRSSRNFADVSITTFSWASENRLLLGTSNGSVFETKNFCEQPAALFSPEEGTILGAVQKIIVTSLYLIVGFTRGKLLWWERAKKITCFTLNDAVFEACMDGNLLDFACSPDFTRILAFGKQGDLHVYWANAKINTKKINNMSSNSDPILDTDKIIMSLTSDHICPERMNVGKCAQVHEKIISAISSIVLTGNATIHLLITGDIGGLIRGWRCTDVSGSKCHLQNAIAELNIGSPVTCLEAIDGYPIFVIGSVDGGVRFVHVGKKKDKIHTIDSGINIEMTVIKSVLLSVAPVTRIAFNSDTKKIAAGCFKSGQVFVLCAEPSNLHVIGVVEVSDKTSLASIMWCKNNLSHLIIASCGGEVSCFDTTTMCFTPEPVPALWTCRLEDVRAVKEIAIMPSMDSATLPMYVIHDGVNGFDCYEAAIGSDCNVITRKIRIAGISKEGNHLTVNTKLRLLVLGSAAGEIHIYHQEMNQPMTIIHSWKFHNGPVLSVAFSADSSYLYTTSSDGCIFVLNIGQRNAVLHSSHEYDYLVPKHQRRGIPINSATKNDERRSTWLCKSKDKVRAEQELKSIKTKQSIKQQLVSIHNRIERLTQDNLKEKEIDRLEPHEFIIDTNADQAIREKIAVKVKDYRDGMVSKIKENSTASSKIKKHHIDTMKEHMCSINEISDNPSFSVTNFPVRSLLEYEKKVIRTVKQIRMNEIAEMKRNKNRSSRMGNCWSTSLSQTATPHFIFDMSSLKEEHYSEEDERKYAQSFSTSQYIDQNETFEDLISKHDCPPRLLLYPPLTIVSTGQRRIQIILLQEVHRGIATQFNDKFSKLMHDRENILDQINKAIDRVEEISNELDESPIHYRVASDAGISVEKECISLVETRFINTNSSFSKTDLDKKDTWKDEDYSRGLMDMMNGTLEVNTLINSIAPVKPEWMTRVSKSQMSESQSRQFEDYERKQIERSKRVEERRHELECEMKRLKSDIVDFTSCFNERLAFLQKERMDTLSIITRCEHYLVILVNGIFRIDDHGEDTKKLFARRVVLKEAQREASESLQNVSLELERVKSDMYQKVTEDRAMEKDFRTIIQQAADEPLDQETVNLLYQFFQRRDGSYHISTRRLKRRCHKVTSNKLSTSASKSITRRSKLGRQSGRDSSAGLKMKSLSGSLDKSNESKAGNDDSTSTLIGKMKLAIKEAEEVEEDEEFISSNDPFFSLDDIAISHTVDGISTIYRQVSFDEIPEGFEIDENIWDIMLNLRAKKFAKEEEIIKDTDTTKEVKALFEVESNKCTTIKRSLDSLEESLSTLHKEKIQQLKCSEFLLVIKQGQDEVEEKSVATDYRSIMFTSSCVIEESNDVLKTLGEEHISVLNQIKDFRKTIKMLKWNHDILDLSLTDAKEINVDYQLLRLSSELKSLLISDTENKAMKYSTTENQILRQHATHEVKIRKLRKATGGFNKSICERKMENEELKKQLDTLTSAVEVKEAASRETKKSANQGLKMRRILKRAKLIGSIRSQSDELTELQFELDKKRQKTYPSFTSP